MAKWNNGHVIEDIDFSKDYLLCNCGWEGKAYDTKAYSLHQRKSEPLNKPIAKYREFTSPFNRSIILEEST